LHDEYGYAESDFDFHGNYSEGCESCGGGIEEEEYIDYSIDN
jgi:formamidopyrimidine-DNA glycosylase